MTIGGDYGSPQKAAIRKRLWDAAISDLLNREGIRGEELRLLDMPGARCIYIRHIIDEFGVLKDNIVAVERDEEPFLAIHHFLGGRGVVRHGLVEDLCENRELEKYFPIDIVNLDFCGQAFVFPDLVTRTRDDMEYQRRWDCVKKVLEFNRAKEKSVWYLLLTLACNRNNQAGKNYLLGQLEEMRKLTGVAKDPLEWKEDRLIQEVVPKVVADEALQRDYIPSATAFDSYRYIQDDHRFHMVAWKFKLELDGAKSLGHNVTRRKHHLDEFCKAYFASDAKELEL